MKILVGFLEGYAPMVVMAHLYPAWSLYKPWYLHQYICHQQKCHQIGDVIGNLKQITNTVYTI